MIATNAAAPATPGRRTLSAIIRARAAADGGDIAYTFLADGSADADSITWSQLDRRADALGARLRERGAAGQPVLLALPSGLAFIESLFGCWRAGAIAVPISLPRHRRVKHRLHQVVADAGARHAIGTSDTRQRLDSEGTEFASAGTIDWIDPDAINDLPSPAGTPQIAADPTGTSAQDIALLQYTSGSTGTPRGVVITHANLLRNSELIAEACGHAPGQTICGWLPLYHDMGLIGLVVQAAYSGARCVLMSPERFLMRPWLWLQAISDYRARSSPAPNFAYDLCAEKVGPDRKAKLDLSCWRNALNGSEPVRAATLDRFASAFAGCGFRREAFFPCYGLAESTLFVTGPGPTRDAPRRDTRGQLLPAGTADGHVACGMPFGDTRLAIVDPRTAVRVTPGNTGEIWVAGESIAKGYHNDPEATAATFGGRLAGEPRATPGGREEVWLRTGDLGFIGDGELYITGRLRELIIVAGRNHFPIDVERTVEAADPAIAPSGAAAFSWEADGAERLVVVAEVRRELARPPRSGESKDFDQEAVRRRVRAAVAAAHEVSPHDVVLLRPGGLPRTTSGKVSRQAARDAYSSQVLERLENRTHADAAN